MTAGIVPRLRKIGPVTLVRALHARFEVLLAELAKFGTVGFLSLLLDLVVFNLVLTVLPDKPLTAKVIATLVSATNAFVLNRHWSFKGRVRRSSLWHEAALFALFNAIGLLIALTCLGVSHYLLGFDNRLADNIAANGVGLVLGTLFRFWSYRRFVWVQAEPEPDDVPVRQAA